MEYKLRDIIKGHKSDVQCVIITDDDDILTGSIDSVIKLWKLDRSSNSYVQSQTFVTDITVSNRVTLFCYVPPNSEFSHGLLASNSSRRNHDISIFSLDSSVCRYKLFGHTRNITKIVNGSKSDTIVSASLDSNVIIWKLTKDCMKSIKTIRVDTNSIVTSLLCVDDTICVGSNDNLIRLYNENSDCLFELAGHTDSVRDLVSYSNADEILSCSNDKTIRRWNIRTAECLNVMLGHESFVFSMAVQSNRFASCGNDRSLLVWNDFSNYAKINLHSAVGSIWSVRFLSNGDIVVGSRQGEIYLFTQHEHLHAEKSMMDKFYQQIEEDEVNMIKLMAEENAKSKGTSVVKKKREKKCANQDHDYLYDIDDEDEELFDALVNCINIESKRRNKRSVSNENTLGPAKIRKKIFDCKMCTKLFEIKDDLFHHQKLHLSHDEKLYESLPQNYKYDIKKIINFEDYCKVKIHLLEVNTKEMAEKWIFKFMVLNNNHHYTEKKLEYELPKNQIFRKHFNCVFVNNMTGGICENSFIIWIVADEQTYRTYVKITQHHENSCIHPANNAADAMSIKDSSFHSDDFKISDISNIVISESEVAEEESVSNKPWELVRETVDIEVNSTPDPVFTKRENKKFIRSVKDNFNKFLLKLEDDVPYYYDALTAFNDQLKVLCESTPEERLISILDFNNSVNINKK